jgi:hypothetical protein
VIFSGRRFQNKIAMKNLIKYFLPTTIFLLGFSCEKNEPVKIDDKCGENSAKFIRVWCVDSWAVINILSNEGIGEDWIGYGKTYKNAVLARLDSSILKGNNNWSKVIGSSDSIFYFNYVSEEIENQCKVCCAPTQTISITSFGSRPCPMKN